MKYLYIVRHAKSSWNFDQLNDMDRPLGTRGRKDILKIGTFLSQNYPTPDLIISSPASRAFYTALFIADAWGYPEEQIRLESRLYHAETDTLLSLIKGTVNADSLVIYGHNPGLTDLANYFSTEYLSNLPTCGVIGFQFDINNWTELNSENGEEFISISPKKLKR